MTANPCLTWVITDTNDPSLTNMNTYKCKIVGGKSKVYLLCDLQNHLRVMFDWYSLSSLHWGLKRKDIGVKWCLRTALYLCARNKYIFLPHHQEERVDIGHWGVFVLCLFLSAHKRIQDPHIGLYVVFFYLLFFEFFLLNFF